MAGRREISSRSWNEVQGSDFLKRLSVGCEDEAIKITTKIVQVGRDEQFFAVIYWPIAEKKKYSSLKDLYLSNSTTRRCKTVPTSTKEVSVTLLPTLLLFVFHEDASLWCGPYLIPLHPPGFNRTCGNQPLLSL